jgi:hypothetical protein
MKKKKIFNRVVSKYRSSPSTIQTDLTSLDAPEYLSQLLKDRRQLAAVPNMFFHVERLLDQGKFQYIYSFCFCLIKFIKEINNVRINLFNLITRPKIELPNPRGEKKIFQDKIFIPVQQYPDVSFYLTIITYSQLMLFSIRGQHYTFQTVILVKSHPFCFCIHTKLNRFL